MRFPRHDPMPIPGAFRAARKLLGLRQLDVAVKIRVSCATISRCETGKISFGNYAASRLKDFFVPHVHFRDDGSVEKLGRINADAYDQQTRRSQFISRVRASTNADRSTGTTTLGQLLANQAAASKNQPVKP